ncbi:MAG: hypothetical protein WCT24_00015 [Patescibacteria group bacterium]|jgi:hypothetical protein
MDGQWTTFTFDTTSHHKFDPWDDLKIEIKDASKQASLPGVTKKPIKVQVHNNVRKGYFEFKLSWNRASKKQKETIYKCKREKTVIVFPNPLLTIEWRHIK